MDLQQERFWDLTTKILAKEASDSEKEELNKYLTEPKFQELFKWMEERWEKYPGTLAGPYNTEEELNRLHLRMNKESIHPLSQKPSKILSLQRSQLLVAAIILVLLSIAGVFWVNQSNSTSQQKITETHLTVYRVGKGQAPEKFSLPDGSTIWLNADSKLEVLNEFRDSVRLVRLEGEAFFEVKRDTSKAFIVQTNSIRTKVLGTSFNISAYQNEPYVVAVEEGKVEVSSERSKQVILTQNQQIFISEQEGIWQESITQTEEISSWRKGVIWCNNSPLETLMPKLERRFGIEFQFKDKRTQKCVIGGKLDVDELNSLLYGLKQLYNIEFEYNEKDHIVYLYGGLCG
ncbi:MAG: FecR domain-containing protein [Bacteroidota bacterium]